MLSPPVAHPIVRDNVLPAPLSWFLCGVITVVAALLRFRRLTAKSFWVDEGISVGIARLPWSKFFLVLWDREANMSFYYLLLHFWMKAGSGEAYVRALSVVFSVAAIPLLYALGARLFGPVAGFAAAWFLAINAFAVRYAQDARSYSLVVFLSVLSTWLLVRNVSPSLLSQSPAQPQKDPPNDPPSQSAASWNAYALVSALAVYSHFYAVLLVPAHAVSLPFLPRERVPWRGFRRALGLFVLLLLPVAVFILHTGTGPVNWIGPPSIGAVYQLMAWFAGSRGKILVIFDTLALLSALFAALQAARMARYTGANWKYALVFAWLALPLAVILAASLVKPLLLPRYLIFCLPALLLATAAGIVRLRPVCLGWALSAVISVLCLQGVFSYYQRDFDIYREDWRDATAYILDRAQPGDGIFFLTFGRMPFDYYKSLRKPASPGATVLNAPGNQQLEVQDFLPVSLAEAIRDARPAPDRVWVVLFYGLPMTSNLDQATLVLRAWYGRDRHLVQQKEFPQIRIFFFDRNQTLGTSSPSALPSPVP